MKAKSFSELLVRDLEQLMHEIKYFPEIELWNVKGTIVNPAGNLALHLCGNLNHFIGANMGDTGYIRDRDKEFSLKDIPRERLIGMIHEVKEMVPSVLEKKSDSWLEENFHVEFAGRIRTNGEMLLQLCSHLNYHLGQINYIRRFIA